MNTVPEATQVDYKKLAKEKDAEIEHLNKCTEILKEHLDFLRNKLREKEEQIEIFSTALVEMDKELKRARPFDLKNISLN